MMEIYRTHIKKRTQQPCKGSVNLETRGEEEEG